MQIFKLLPAFALLGVAYAGPLERRQDSVADCIKKEAWKTADKAPQGTPDVAICYNGLNSLVDPTGPLNRSPDRFGGLHKAVCEGVTLDCFWMRRANKWFFYGSAAPDSLAVIHLSDKCELRPDLKQVSCA